MKQHTLISGLKEEDFMTLRWYADVHTVHEKTGDYKILNNNGVYLGEIVKDSGDNYKIMVYEKDMGAFSRINKEVMNIERVSNMITHKQLNSPIIYDEKDLRSTSPYVENYRIFGKAV